MKKLVLVAALAGLFTTSCKKDYTCKCTEEDGSDMVTYTGKMKKKDAENWCNNWDATAKTVDGKCELK